MDFLFSKHADKRLIERNLNREIVLLTLQAPDTIIVEDHNLLIYQKIIRESEKPYLCRVFVNPELEPNLIITVYKTSKLDKYENQIR